MFRFWIDYYHRRLSKKAPPILIDYMHHLPDPSTPCAKARLLALDFETTGLNPKRDHILSMGWVEIRSMRIPLSTAEHYLIKNHLSLSESNIAIHQITEQDMQAGLELEQALNKLFKKLTGRLLLAHHAAIEARFIQQACLNHYGIRPKLAVIDTMRIAQQRLERRQPIYSSKQLRLFNLRRSYGLPDYPPHHALYDALSCAELWLAQISTVKKSVSIRSFLHYI